MFRAWLINVELDPVLQNNLRWNIANNGNDQ